MTDLLQRVEQNILDRHLLKDGQSVLVAVSGGVDSMTLLHVLQALAMRHRWKLTVGHYNHQLRGRSSNADEKLVRNTTVALKLPFIAGRADVQRFADTSKLSIEMAARKLRHEFFARAARERKISVVALAHHADDQVELFFLRVLRGAGGEGLAGMKWRSRSPVDDRVTLVRPLLDVTRTELRGFAREKKVRFREDATNARLDLPRNRVRNELLPLLRSRYQPALTRTILRLMEIVGAEAEVVGGMAQQWLGHSKRDKRAPRPVPLPARRGEGGRRPDEENPFAQLPVAIQRRVLHSQLAQLGVWVDFDLVERLRCSSNISVSVTPGLSVTRDVAGRAGKVSFNGIQFSWKFESAKKTLDLDKRSGCEYFDAARVGGRIILRHWRAGDRFQPIGLKSAVKLQDLFVNQKIPRSRRHDLVVAEAAQGGIFWVDNLRVSESFKLTPATRRRLVWRWRCASR